jgi:hypothetical protein
MEPWQVRSFLTPQTAKRLGPHQEVTCEAQEGFLIVWDAGGGVTVINRPVVCLAGLFVAALAHGAPHGAPHGAAFHGKLELTDVSNAGRAVGPSVSSGIPQGHTLRICITKGRFGKDAAADASVLVEIRSGAEAIATGQGALDKTGSGEVLLPVGAEWDGQYHIDVKVTEAFPPPEGARTGRLQREFRVIEGEPAPEIPFALPAVLTVLAAVTLVVWWTRRSPQTA